MLHATILSLIESSRSPKTMDDSVRLLVGAKCDAELDLVKQAVISHEHGERKKEKKKRKEKRKIYGLLSSGVYRAYLIMWFTTVVSINESWRAVHYC